MITSQEALNRMESSNDVYGYVMDLDGLKVITAKINAIQTGSATVVWKPLDSLSNDAKRRYKNYKGNLIGVHCDLADLFLTKLDAIIFGSDAFEKSVQKLKVGNNYE